MIRSICVTAVLVAMPIPEAVEAQAAKWTVRGSFAWVGSSGDDLAAALPTGEPFRFSVDDGGGIGVELEYRLKPKLGIELALVNAEIDSELSVMSGGATLRDAESSTFELVSLGVNYHFSPTRSLDLHVGAFAAMTNFDDVIFLTEVGRRDKLVFDDDVGFGVKFGLDRSFGASDRWLASLSFRYLSAILEGEAAGQDSDLDPLILSVGIGYRF